MRLSGSRARLMALTRELARRWESTRVAWDDDKAREFEETYLNELVNEVNRVVVDIENLDRLLSQIHADCE
jgi:hypothetical protein